MEHFRTCCVSCNKMATAAALRTRMMIGSRFSARLPQRRFVHPHSAYLVNVTQMKLVSCCRENERIKMGSCGGCRLYSEAPDKTTVRKLDVVDNVNAPYVSKYSTEGFNIRGNRVIGSVALLPTALLHWTVSCCIDT